MYVQSILDTKGTKVVAARPEDRVSDTVRLLTDNRIGAALVLDEGGSVVGVISERDIVAALAAHGPRVGDLTVAELMTREVLHCRPTDTIESIMALMTQRRVRHLPVLDEGRLVGIVSIGDVVKHRLDEAALEVDSLRQYVLAGR